MPPGPILTSCALVAGGKARIKAALPKINGKNRFISLYKKPTILRAALFGTV